MPAIFATAYHSSVGSSAPVSKRSSVIGCGASRGNTQDDPRNISFFTFAEKAARITLRAMARFSARNSTGWTSLAWIPPTRAAARKIASGLVWLIHRSVGSCFARSTCACEAVRISQPSLARRRAMAEPASPEWPATVMRFPRRSKRTGGAIISGLALAHAPAHAGFGLAAKFPAVFLDHFDHQGIEIDPVFPSELGPRFRGIADEIVDFRGPEIARIDLDEHLAACLVDAGLAAALAPPCDLAADDRKRARDELAHRVAVAGREHIVVGPRLLEDHPHALDVVAGVTPVAPGIEISDEQAILPASFDRGHGAGNLARHERFAADRAFVVEQNSVRGVNAIGLPIIHRHPVSVKLGGSVRASRRKRRSFILRTLRRVAVTLGCRGLIKSNALFELEDPDRLEQPQGAQGVGIGRVFAPPDCRSPSAAFPG